MGALPSRPTDPATCALAEANLGDLVRHDHSPGPWGRPVNRCDRASVTLGSYVAVTEAWMNSSFLASYPICREIPRRRILDSHDFPTCTRELVLIVKPSDQCVTVR